ncbi:MAG: Hsp33 family molecular chaperone HslO [Bacillota bacterium]
MSDHVLIATAADGFVRALAAVTTDTVSEAQRRHDSWPTATAALGRTLTAGALMGAMLKDKQRVTLRVLGDGPIGAIVVDADHNGNVRGYVQEPHVHLAPNEAGKLDVAGAVGQGYLHVIKDLGLREPYQGSIPLVSGELAEDFTHYFAVSEQTPSAVALGVLVGTDNQVQASGGFLIQLLPGASEQIASALERQLQGLPSVTEMISGHLDAEGILRRALSEMELRILETRPTRFSCSCNRKRLEGVLISLGSDELASMEEEQGGAELTCHFCRHVYQFSKEELQELRRQISAKHAEQ